MKHSPRLAWLNGHSALRDGDSSVVVWEGIHLHCAGCGKLFGPAAAYAIPSAWEPGPFPDWPFPEDNCPICALRASLDRAYAQMAAMIPRPEPKRVPLDPKRLP